MRKSIVATAGVAILGVVALSACDFSFGKKSDAPAAEDSGSDADADAGSGASGASATGSSSGAKPEDDGAGSSSTSGPGDEAGSGSTGDREPPTGGFGSGGSTSGGGSTGGGGMREIGEVIEGFNGQLDGYLDNYQQNLASGFGPSGVQDVITGLQAGNEYRWNVGTLRGGQTYRFMGACDQDCTDVDIVVEDENGIEVGSDYALDDHPVVTITPRRDGAFTVRILLVDCAIEPCYVAGRVLQQGR